MTQLQAPTDTTISLLQQQSKEKPMVETSTAETEMVEEPKIEAAAVEAPTELPTFATAKVTSKGQITIPQAAREELGIKPGDLVEFEMGPEATMFRRIPDLLELAGTIEIPPDLQHLSVEELVEMGREAWAREAAARCGL